MKYSLLFICCLLSGMVFSQQKWNQRLPFQVLGDRFTYMDASYKDGRFLTSSLGKMAELDAYGTFTGYSEIPAGQSLANFMRRRYHNNGESSFLIGSRFQGKYSLRFYNPNQGITGELIFPDSLPGTLQPQPLVLELTDDNLMVITRKTIYKVLVHQNDSCSIVWQAPLPVQNKYPATAAEVNGNVVVFSTTGDIIGIDGNGQPLFSKNEAFNVYSAATLPDGIIACGENQNGQALLVKLSHNGDVLWSKTYQDKAYRAVIRTADGGLAMTGKSAADKVILLKTDANGTADWSKEYQPGAGGKLIGTPDGGYFIMALAPSVYAIKTDALGETAAPEKDDFIETRQLKSAGVKAILSPIGSVFSGLFNNGGLVSPPDSGNSTIGIFAPWIGNASGSNEIAANDYSVNFVDFHAGMIGASDRDFRRVWLAKKTDITAFRRDFLEDNTVDATVPYDLLTWPAKGNVHNRYNLDFSSITTNPDLQSAPFVDVNGDGIYNVFDGDYPQIKGDQMVWWIVNDDSIHYNTDGERLKVDIAISVYLYDCQENESVKNSVFVDVDIINRSDKNYLDTYLGFFTDLDFNCSAEYIGSIPEANTYYAYRTDDPVCPVPVPVTGSPLQSITLQNRSLDHLIYYNNGSIGAHPAAQTDPSSVNEFFNYLQGRWRDGTPLTQGGSGFNPSSTDVVSHVFPGNPSDPLDWTMCSANLPFGDRRILPSHGPFQFLTGETFKTSVAFTTHHDIPQPCPDIYGLLKPRVEQLTGWSSDGTLGAGPGLGVVRKIKPGETLTLGSDIPGATFQWSTGATSATITVAATGEYSVTVTSQAGCQLVENVLVTLNTNVNSPAPRVEWSLYPNPAQDFVQVVYPDAMAGAEIEAVLRNVQGIEVKRQHSLTGYIPINLKGLSNGFYWMELWQGGTFLGSRKFVHAGN